MAKRSTAAAKRKHTLGFDPAADYGPSFGRSRDGRWISGGPAMAVIEDREDISHELNKMGRRPVVRGARRWDALSGLLRDGTISDHQHKAGQRFLDDLSRAQGGGKASFLQFIRSIGSTPDGITEVQIRALKAIQHVRLMLGLPNDDSVFTWVVLHNRTVCEYAKAHHMRASQPYDWLRNSLDRLDSYYHP